MSIKSDIWIKKMSLENDMISPFQPNQVKTNQAGEIKFNPKKWSTEFKTSTIFEFLISENAMDILSKSILDFPELRSLDFENSYYEKSLRELVGVETADKIMENLMVSGKI